MIRDINTEKVKNIEIEIQPETDFHTEEDRHSFYKNFSMNDEPQRISLGNKNLTTIYLFPGFRNLAAIHLLSEFSANKDQKGLTDSYQKRLILTPGAWLSYQSHMYFFTYIADSDSILAIYNSVKPIPSLIPEHFI